MIIKHSIVTGIDTLDLESKLFHKYCELQLSLVQLYISISKTDKDKEEGSETPVAQVIFMPQNGIQGHVVVR